MTNLKLKTKKLLAMCLIVATVLTLTACGSTSNGNSATGDNTKLSFGQGMTYKDLKGLDGDKVELTGFMATISPLNGAYVYLQNIPYQNCPFCVPNTTELANTMAVYAPEGESIPFIDSPVTVYGELEIGDFTDDYGYTYKYRIINAKVAKADVTSEEYNETIQLYASLVDTGYAMKFSQVMNTAYQLFAYDTYGIKKEDLTPIDMEEVKWLRTTLDKFDRTKYEAVYSSLEKLEEVAPKMNELLADKDFETLSTYGTPVAEAYQKFYNWLVSPSL